MKADKISVPLPYSTYFYSHFKVVKSLVSPVPNFPYAPCRQANMAMCNLVKIWHTKVLVFLWYGPSLYLLFQFSKLFGNPPSNIEAPSNKLYTVQYRSLEKFSHDNKFYFLRSILAINIEILIIHVKILSKYLQTQVVFI